MNLVNMICIRCSQTITAEEFPVLCIREQDHADTDTDHFTGWIWHVTCPPGRKLMDFKAQSEFSVIYGIIAVNNLMNGGSHGIT